MSFRRMSSLLVLVFAACNAQGAIILQEDFEDGVLDPRISVVTRGSYISQPGIKPTAIFGSTKAFAYGRSTNRYNSYDNYVTDLVITLPQPTLLDSVSFRTMELYDNWGSAGNILVDGVLTHWDEGFGRMPYNDRQADSTYRDVVFTWPAVTGRVVEIKVVDITDRSEIYIDNIVLRGTVPEPACLGMLALGCIVPLWRRRRTCR